ncbi:MAG TPA: BamA/TamA family outer membrane protein [Chitinophagales bacterium]|nr:BamA/TamA family outer membrane protein [Chitinophagales bacterium]
MIKKVQALKIVCIALVLMVSACSPSKFLQEGQVMYQGADLKFSQPEKIVKKKDVENAVKDKIVPKANSKFLGLFYTKQWLYSKVTPNPDKKKSLKHWMKNKLGEKPILMSDVDNTTMEKVVQKSMQDNGYFNTFVKSEAKVKKQTGKYIYTVENNGPTYIHKFTKQTFGSQLDTLITDFDKKFFVKVDKIYHLENFTKDRTQLAEYIRKFGYYDFDSEDIFYLIDTAHVGDSIDVQLRIQAPKDDTIHRKYFIRNVDIYTVDDIVTRDDSIPVKEVFDYKDLTIHQDHKFLDKKVFYRNTLIETQQPFSIEKYNYTASRYVNMNLFKYVNIQYDKSAADSLDVNIFLTPAQHQSFEADVEASTSNRSFLGTSVSVSYINNNLYRKANKLTIKISAGTEFQSNNGKAQLNIINTNFEIRQDIPRLVGFKRDRKDQNETAPKTYIKAQVNFQKWLQYYTLYSIQLAYGYEWNKTKRIQHAFEPISINRITIANKTQEFEDLLDKNPLLKKSFENLTIIGGNYTFSLNTQKRPEDKSYIFFNAYGEIAGNTLYSAFKLFNKNGEQPYKILKSAFSQYAKTEFELRHYWDISRKSRLVTRINTGIGVGYGNSETLPYVKQFFVGGPNTLRAFPFRSVGPGRYTSSVNGGEINPIEQTGDIKLIMNAEYRYTIYKFIRLALFVDAGNIWLLKDDPKRPDGEFKFNNFYQQLALGTGLGLRLDFDFFVIRADLGIPLYKPYLDEGTRWVNEFPEDNFKDWRKKNFVWNIAIGYPF